MFHPYYGNSFQCIYCSMKDPKLTHPADALYYIISALKANWVEWTVISKPDGLKLKKYII